MNYSSNALSRVFDADLSRGGITYFDALTKPVYEIFYHEENEEKEETIFKGYNINVFKPFNGRVKLKKELMKIEEQLDLIARIVEQKIT